MPEQEIRGITVFGLTSFLSSREQRGLASYQYADGCLVPEMVSGDQAYLAADILDNGIRSGALTRGIFNHKTVHPQVAAWPERWKFLKEC